MASRAGEISTGALVEQSIRVESAHLILNERSVASLTHVLVAGIALWVGGTEAAWRENLAWSALLLIYASFAIWSSARYKAGPLTEARVQRWTRAMYVSMVVIALIYNAMFMRMAHHGVPHAIDYLTLTVVGLSAGGTARYHYMRGLAPTFMATAILPQVAYHLAWGDESGPTMALLLLVFLAMMTQTSFTLNAHARERLHLGRELHAARLAAEQLARRDPLTGLPNRLACFELGKQLLAVARRHGRPMSVVMLDIDHFKTINDRYGHAGGDDALVAVARALRDAQRESDVVSRVGGEEFAILLPDTDATGATQLAERMREAVRQCRAGGAAVGVRLTASFGAAQLATDDQTLSDLIARADQALYRAKAEGRDQVSLMPATGT